MKKKYSKIVRIEKKGKSDVLDFTVENTHRILANNFYTSNCDVTHPDIIDFIDAKLEQGKVVGANISVKITDVFMNSLVDGKFIQKFPIKSENPILEKIVNSNDIWKKIINNAWRSAEPGVLFIDTILKESLPDCYSDNGFETVSTNPCVVGDTLIAVADGRNHVSIKQLVEEGKDILVYCLDNNGKLVIRTMRNPRITGYNQPIYKITLENGHTQRVTGNHKFKLKNDIYVQTKDIKNGDSLHILTKYKASMEEIFPKSSSSSDYYWLNNGEETSKSEHRFLYEQNTNTNIQQGYVIHHKDFNSLNNSIDNLQLMTIFDHNNYHEEMMKGDKNPYHKMSDEWNSNYIGISNDDIKKHAIILTKKLNRRFSKKDWVEYSIENNIPRQFSVFKGNIISLAKIAAIELNIDSELINVDPILVKTYKKALENGYDSKIVNNVVLIKKICETCQEEFWLNYFNREISFCSIKCSTVYLNNDNTIKEKRMIGSNKYYDNKNIENKQKQLDIFTKLRFDLQREPFLKEWENKCEELKIPYRLNTNIGFKNFKELKEEAETYNHRVISIELDGYEDVYTGTVDEYHNFFSGGFIEKTKSGKDKYIYVNSLQCGEIPLCVGDSCRLTALNLYSYVVNPFTEKSYFDFELFKTHVRIAMRIMDNIVDLELEKIDKILEKIENDKEPDDIKHVEKSIWNMIKQKTIDGRRTGLGITAEGDMLAAMNLKYGTKEATEFSTSVHKTMAIEVYKSSSIMAKERGTFPIYSRENEKDNIFLNRLMDADSELKDMIKSYGRRNIATMTAAPTGSISILTQTTSGIEPVFLISYKRRKKINSNDVGSRIDFTDENGDNWEEYLVFHPKFLKWLIVNEYDVEMVKTYDDDKLKEIINKSPYYGATSADVDWMEKVRMQGSIQKWIDHSISCTINLPKEATEELVEQLYRSAWEVGCKGVTIYRDGSRNGVLVSKNEKRIDSIIKENNVPKRPKILECDVIRFSSKGEKWIGFIGLSDNKPYEIFTGILANFQVPSFVEKGSIKKNKDEQGNSRYDFVYMDIDGYEQEMRGLSRAFNREFWNIGKMVSALLRHNIHLPSIINLIDSLYIGDDNIVSWKSGVKRMLKKYIKDETTETSEKCPECGSSLIKKEGCTSCTGCDYSLCG